MQGSLLQLYYNSNITLKYNVSDITFFRSVYLKYNNFTIETIINNSKHTDNFGEINEIEISNYGNFLNSLTFKIELSPLSTSYILNSSEYKNNLLYNNNLNSYFNYYFSTNQLFKLNLLQDVINETNNKFNIFTNNNNKVFKIDTNKINNLNLFNVITTNNEIQIFNNEKIYEINNGLYSIYDINFNYNINSTLIHTYNNLYKIIFDDELLVLYNSYLKNTINDYYTNLNLSTSILIGLKNYIKNIFNDVNIPDFIINKYKVLDYLKNYNLTYNKNYNFNIFNDNILITLNTDNLNNNTYIIFKDGSNLIFTKIIDTINNVKVINLVKNTKLLNYDNTKLIINNIIITGFNVIKINTISNQYKIILNIDNNTLTNNLYIYIIDDSYNIKTIFYVNNIIILNNIYELYCMLYDDNKLLNVNLKCAILNIST